MTTKEAFNKLLTQLKKVKDNPVFEKLGYPPQTVRSWKWRKRDGKITLDKMEEILKKAGWKKTPESWREPE